MTKSIRVSVTGHRPERCESEDIVRLKVRTKLRYTDGIVSVTGGMADGFDLWAMDEARILGIPLIAARPWAGHAPSRQDEELYFRVLESAIKRVDISDTDKFPGNWCYFKRNEWLVDNCDALLCYWDGDSSGGTHHCRDYAKKKGIPVANLFNAPPF